MKTFALLLLCAIAAESFGFRTKIGCKAVFGARGGRGALHAEKLQYDAQGYLIKPRDWFNGLSSDPGNSLDDPRSVPPPAIEFANKIKRGEKVSFKETISFLDTHYTYFEVPMKVGSIYSKPNENTGTAKILSFGLMTRMSETEALSMFGEIYRDLSPNGTDHPNIREFQKVGWPGVSFETGLCISSVLQTGTTTEEVEATQAPVLEKGESWSFDSESFIP